MSVTHESLQRREAEGGYARPGHSLSDVRERERERESRLFTLSWNHNSYYGKTINKPSHIFMCLLGSRVCICVRVSVGVSCIIVCALFLLLCLSWFRLFRFLVLSMFRLYNHQRLWGVPLSPPAGNIWRPDPSHHDVHEGLHAAALRHQSK